MICFWALRSGRHSKQIILLTSSRRGAVDRQANEAAVVEGLVPLGAAYDLHDGGSRGGGIQSLRKVPQGVVSKIGADAERPPSPGAHQGLQPIITPLAQKLPH